MSHSSDLLDIIYSGIDAVRPSVLFPQIFHQDPYPEFHQWRNAKNRYLLSIGKAGTDSAAAILKEAECNDYFIIGPQQANLDRLDTRKIHLGSHPVPDEKSEAAARDLLAWLATLPDHASLLVVLSGGASALMVSPLEGVPLSAKMKVNHLLLRSGASIQEMNAVRKHLSAVKGGRLAAPVSHLQTVVLVISDVIGDDLSVIGSGPFYPDSTTFVEARDILSKHGVWEEMPEEAQEAIEKGVAGGIPETPKTMEQPIPHYIIASNRTAREAAAQRAAQLGYKVEMQDEPVSGLVPEVVRKFVSLLKSKDAGTAIISGGEVTVRLTGNGTGGRNQHLALLLTRPLADTERAFAAAGTDGVDGNSNAAGAWTDGRTVARATQKGLDIEKAIIEFDSYPFFQSLGQSILTGPTGTNVMDLYIGLC